MGCDMRPSAGRHKTARHLGCGDVVPDRMQSRVGGADPQCAARRPHGVAADHHDRERSDMAPLPSPTCIDHGNGGCSDGLRRQDHGTVLRRSSGRRIHRSRGDPWRALGFPARTPGGCAGRGRGRPRADGGIVRYQLGPLRPPLCTRSGATHRSLSSRRPSTIVSRPLWSPRSRDPVSSETTRRRPN
jgi:hypothetical protein